MRSGRDILAIAAARIFRKSAREIERGADCLFGVISPARREIQKRNDSFAVGRVQICAGIAQQVGRARDEFFARPRSLHTGVVTLSARSYLLAKSQTTTLVSKVARRAIEFNFA